MAVTILPCSGLTYVEAVASQRKEDLIKACENAILYYGGAPVALVPDNLKAAVARPDKIEPVIQEDFAEFAEHYGCCVYPARVRHPQDKALVENAVKLAYREIYPAMENKVFHSLSNLNKMLHEALEDFNNRLPVRRSRRAKVSTSDIPLIESYACLIRQVRQGAFHQSLSYLQRVSRIQLPADAVDVAQW